MSDPYVVTFAAGDPTPGRRKHKLDATTAPTSGDDLSTDGYEVGSTWVDVTNDKAYLCVDSTTAAAIWKQIGGVGADSGSLDTDPTVTGAHSIDRGDGETHDLTLTGNATFTLAGALTGLATDLRLVLRQDGTGSRTVTWPTITWAGGIAPTLQTAANAVDTIGLLSVDDGATWFGYFDQTGGGSGDVASDAIWDAKGDVAGGTGANTAAVLSVGADGQVLTADSGETTGLAWAAAGGVTAAAVKAVGRWEPVQHDGTDPVARFNEASPPMPFVYFNGEIVVAFIETP